MSTRSTQKELKQPDRFQVIFGQLAGGLKTKKNEVLAGVVTVIAVSLAIILFAGHQSRQEAKAIAALSDVETQVWDWLTDHQVPTKSREPKADKEKAEGESATDDVEAAGLIASLEQITKDHSGTRAGDLTHFYIAEITFYQKQYDRALEEYGKYLKSLPGSSPYRAIVYTAQAYCYEALKDLEKSAQHFLKAASIETNPNRDQAYLNAARVYEGLDQIDKAKTYYQVVVTDFPESSLATFSKSRLNEINQAKTEQG